MEKQEKGNHEDAKTVICPECQNDVDISNREDLEVGDIIECQYCGSDLEVVSVDADGNVQIQLIEEEK